MNDLVSRGIGIIFVTSELKEILAIADRIIVMSQGKITGEFGIEQATEEELVRASAIGHKPGANLAQR
jgi:erythritol transport system ATP-binding protein